MNRTTSPSLWAKKPTREELRKRSLASAMKQKRLSKAPAVPKWKDPEGLEVPKRAQSPYVLFGTSSRSRYLIAGDQLLRLRVVIAERKKLQVEKPHLTTAEVMKETGQRWRELSEKERSQYLDQAMLDRLRYQVQIQTYLDLTLNRNRES